MLISGIELADRLAPGIDLLEVCADEKGRFDELVDTDGVQILIDPAALMHVIGTKMDFVTNRIKYADLLGPFSRLLSCCCRSLQPTGCMSELAVLARRALLEYCQVLYSQACPLQVRIYLHKSQFQGQLRLWRVIHYVTANVIAADRQEGLLGFWLGQ